MNDVTRIENASGDYLEWRYAPGQTAEIVDIKVLSERVRGKGRALVETLVNHLKSKQAAQPVRLLYAFARADNEIARGFYTAIGFIEVVRIPNFYRDSQPARDAILWGYYL